MNKKTGTKKQKIIDSRAQQCQRFIKQNKLDEALKCAIILVIDYPKSAKAYSVRGQVYYLKGEYNIALKDINRAISLAPKESTYYSNRGMIYSKLGDFPTAIKDFSTTIKLNPKYAYAYMARSSAYELQGKRQEALSDINKYIKFMPKSSNGYYIRARLHYKGKRMEESLSDCFMAEGLDPKNVSAIDLKGMIYFMRGQFDKGLREFNKAVNLAPKMSGYYKNRAICYWLLGNRNAAIEDLKKAIKLFPKFFRSYYHLGYFMHQEKDKDKAKSYFLRAFELYPNVLQEWENVFEFTTNPQVIQFFRDELALGKEYLIASGKILPPDDTMLEVKSIQTNPEQIRIGEKFVIVIEYMVSDPSINSEKLPVYMNFRIIEGEKVLFKSGSILLQSKQGVKTTRRQNMNPTQRKGEFKVEVTLSYKNKTTSKAITINIS